MGRIMLPNCAANIVASSLSYAAVKIALEQESSELKRKFMNTNGPFDFTSEPLLFPCCIEYVSFEK